MSRGIDILLGEILDAIDLLRAYTDGLDFDATSTTSARPVAPRGATHPPPRAVPMRPHLRWSPRASTTVALLNRTVATGMIFQPPERPGPLAKM